MHMLSPQSELAALAFFVDDDVLPYLQPASFVFAIESEICVERGRCLSVRSCCWANEILSLTHQSIVH